jgi:hypothetical protein
MIDTCHFRVASYSPSTSQITAHVDCAASLHKFLEDEGVRLEPMVEASGGVLRCYTDEGGAMHMDSEIAIVTFVADATPALLQPILHRWFENLSAPSQHEENQQNGNGNSDEPEGHPAPGA